MNIQELQKQIRNYGAENFIIFNTSDVIEVETELRWLDE